MAGSPQRLSAGQRDRTLTIEQLTETVGPTQFPLETWAPLVTVQGAYDDESGTESFVANQISSAAFVRWTIPYRADCDPELLDVVKIRRVVANGRIYDIVAATQIGRRSGLELRTRAKVG
jgi:SPP1 family predicted phage head-tail adaptor